MSTAFREGHLDLERVRQIIQAVRIQKDRFKNPYGMMCFAVAHHDQGENLLYETASSRPLGKMGPKLMLDDRDLEGPVDPQWGLPSHCARLISYARYLGEPADLDFLIARGIFTKSEILDFASHFPEYSIFSDWARGAEVITQLRVGTGNNTWSDHANPFGQRLNPLD